MKKILFGAAIGYVFGARAGRERYAQIIRTYRTFADHPVVQGAAGIAWAKVSEKIGDSVPFLSTPNSHPEQSSRGSSPDGGRGTRDG